jgi:hypothetical protein
MNQSPSVVVLGEPDHDPLVVPLLRQLAGLTSAVRLVRTSAWARTPISIGDQVWVDRALVKVFIDRSGYLDRFTDDFHAEDAAFAEAESKAALLAILTHPGLRILNRAEASWWFAPHPWPALRGLLAAAGVAVAPLTVGATSSGTEASTGDYRWLTWSGVDVRTPPPGARDTLLPAVVTARTSTSLWCDGRVVDGSAGYNSRRAMDQLRRLGIRLVSLTTDVEDRIVKADPRPAVPEHLTVTVATALVEVVADAAVLR